MSADADAELARLASILTGLAQDAESSGWSEDYATGYVSAIDDIATRIGLSHRKEYYA